jgi:hypothetical protein
MAAFIEVTHTFKRTINPSTMAQHQIDDTAPVMLAVAHIVAVRPHWDEQETWTHTDVSMINGTTWRTEHLTDEIERAIKADTFCARVVA